jgi:tetratricopeptide (TPR) repeat protein
MAKVSLRSYNNEIDRLIDNNQLDEAIAHCIHVLGIYPKHVDTYRLLGKAFLERQRYNDAADMFLRVLAIFPDDFVAHIGISIVREELSDLNLAVFHMERAFEVQPTNTAIQDELKRLYGKRDGVAPTKIRLTHPALARLYSKGELNQQALGELSVAISDAPFRTDILAQLAELYTREGQHDEAIETCNKLIEQLPYCYGALNVLTRLLPGTPFAQDAPIYQARINELDPYFEFKSNINEPSSEVQEDAVTIEPLVWSPDSELTVNKSDWINSLGLKLVEPAQVNPALFQKKAPVASYTQDETPTVPRIRTTTHPIQEQSPVSIPVPPISQSGPDATSQADLPDWMQSAGWSKSDDFGPESPSVYQTGKTPTMPSVERIQRNTDNLPPLPAENEPTVPGDEKGTQEAANTIEPGSIPDWVRSIAPPDLTSPQPDTISSSESISGQAIDDAFSAIFPSSQPQTNPQQDSLNTSFPDGVSFPGQEQPVPATPATSGDVTPPVPPMDEENIFSLDDLRKEMDMVSDLPIHSESTTSSDPLMAESMDNGNELDNLRKSFHTEEFNLGGEPMSEDELQKNESLPIEEPVEAPIPVPEVSAEKVEPLQEVQPEPISESQEAITPEELRVPQASEPATPENVPEPSSAAGGEIPVWLKDLGDGKKTPEAQPAPADQEELPAWLQDFEQKIEDQTESPAEVPPSGPEQSAPPAESAEKIDWRLNLPPKSESKFHTQELPEIPGLNLTETPDQYEVEAPTKPEPPAAEVSYESQPAPAPDDQNTAAPVFSGGETTIIAPPISKVASEEEDERPAWLSKLIGIDDIETPSTTTPVKSTSTGKEPSEKAENIDDIAGSMQAAWMVELLAEKKSGDQAPSVSIPSQSQASEITSNIEIPAEPDLSKEAVVEVPAPSTGVQSSNDIEKMLEGIQPATPVAPVEPEPVVPETPWVPESQVQDETDLGQLIGNLQDVPAPAESVPPTPAPSLTPEPFFEDQSDFLKVLKDLDDTAKEPPLESGAVPPQEVVMPPAQVEPSIHDLGDIPDLIKMVDDLKAIPDSTPAVKPPAPVVSPAESMDSTATGAEPAAESVTDNDVPDLSLIVEGLQAAWMSEHGEDGEVKHTGKLHDIYVPPSGAAGTETILIKRPGAAPVETPPEPPQNTAEPPEIVPPPIVPVPEPEVIVPEVKPLPEAVIPAPHEQASVSEQKPSVIIPEPEKSIPDVIKTAPQPVSRPFEGSSGSGATSAEDILKDARAAFSHGVLDESLDRYVELISRNRMIESVIEDLVSMTTVQGDQSDVWQTLGDAYTRRNQLDQALSAYLKAEELLK